jgi:hypothetical protein
LLIARMKIQYRLKNTNLNYLQWREISTLRSIVTLI